MILTQRLLHSFLGAASVGLLLCAAGCGGGSHSAPQAVPITVSLVGSTVTVPQDGIPVAVQLLISSTSETALVSLSNLPAGLQWKYAATDTNPSGTLTFTASTSAPAGTYMPTVTVNSAGQTASASFTLVVTVVTTIGNSVDATLGVDGKLEQFMTTSFQIGGWSTNYFGSGATATSRVATLNALQPQHVRVQVAVGAVPMVSNTGQASDWDFTILDQSLQPLLEVADHSPELQIAIAPTWMCLSNGNLDVTNHLSDLAVFSANLVRYYNKGGFDVGGTHFQSQGKYPIQWWGIFNEFNGNGLSATDYVKLYNAVVSAMLAVDPTIKLAAFEFSDYGLGTGDAGDPMQFLPTFLAPANAGGVSAQVDAMATHFYSLCGVHDTDADVFTTIPQFVANVDYFYQELQTRSDLKSVPVWVTENNVDADFKASNGMSTCNPSQVFVTDQRGTSAFFAAWRPYLFSQLGKAGNHALFQWNYTGDTQYGEVDPNGIPYLSYWVDKALGTMFPSTASSPGPNILSTQSTDTTSVETLATRNSDGSVVAMIVDRAVASPSDNNGLGAPRTVVVDISGAGTFSSASLLTIDAATNTASGPTAATVPLASRISITLPGYGVAFLSLTP